MRENGKHEKEQHNRPREANGVFVLGRRWQSPPEERYSARGDPAQSAVVQTLTEHRAGAGPGVERGVKVSI